MKPRDLIKPIALIYHQYLQRMHLQRMQYLQQYICSDKATVGNTKRNWRQPFFRSSIKRSIGDTRVTVRGGGAAGTASFLDQGPVQGIR